MNCSILKENFDIKRAVQEFLLGYNNRMHTTTKFKPNEIVILNTKNEEKKILDVMNNTKNGRIARKGNFELKKNDDVRRIL